GARVVVTGRDAERGRAVVGVIEAAGDEATFLHHELDGSVEGSSELAELATSVYGSIDVLVNNAGIYPPGGTLAIDGDTFDPMMATTPLGRLVTPDAIARAAVFLASDDATDVHGTVFDVDGGRSSVLFAAR